MSKITIITDSTSYLPTDLVQKYGIKVAPQVLVWDQETFRDGVDIQPGEFYSRLATAKTMPSTSQATPGAFQALFKEELEQGNQVCAVLLSQELSGTINSAVQACEQFPGAAIEIVDSRTTAMAMGFLVLAAARAAEDGASLQDVCKLVAENSKNTGLIFAVDTLEFLHRGGRIGGASRFLGTALNIKPILEVRGGKVESIEKVRTRKKSIQRLVELMEERIDGRKPVRIASLHANAAEDAKELLETATQKFNAVESIFSEVSPVVGTHTGPGTVGLAFMAGL